MEGTNTLEGLIVKELKRFPRQEATINLPVSMGTIISITPEYANINEGGHLNKIPFGEFFDAELECILNTLKATMAPTMDTGVPVDEVYESSSKMGVFVGDEDVSLCEILTYSKGGEMAIMHNSHYSGRSILTAFKLGNAEDWKKAAEELKAIGEALIEKSTELYEKEN